MLPRRVESLTDPTPNMHARISRGPHVAITEPRQGCLVQRQRERRLGLESKYAKVYLDKGA